MLNAQIAHRVAGMDTGFVYVDAHKGNPGTRVGFCPVGIMRREGDPADRRICVWLANGWPQPSAYQFASAVSELRRAYPHPRGIVIDGGDGLVEVKY